MTAHRTLPWALVVGLVCLLGAAAAAATNVLSVGDVIPAGPATPDDPSHLSVDETVVATGDSPVAGPWRLTTYESEKSAAQPAGLPCLRLVLLHPPDGTPIGSSGFCGEVPDGLGVVSLPVVDRGGGAELLVAGRAPKGADAVRLVGDDAELAQGTTHDGLFVIATRRGSTHATLAALDAGGRAIESDDASSFFERLRALQRIPGR